MIFFIVGVLAGLQIKLKISIDQIHNEKKRQIDMTQRLIYELVTQKQMDDYFERLDRKIDEIKSSRGKSEKERWSRIEQAFGGKKGEE